MSLAGKIVHNVPIPERRNKYVFGQMKVKESVWYELNISYVASLLYGLKQRQISRGEKPFKFTSRTENGGTRVWRVE